MSGGAFCILTPIYIAEIADKDLREQLLMYFHLLINCGIMYAFVVAHILDERDTIWRYLHNIDDIHKIYELNYNMTITD